MNDRIQFTRRRLLKTAIATSATGFALPIAANDASPASATETIIDTHVYIGHWPHARLAGEDPNDIITMLRDNQVTQAWVGSFGGLFHKDIAAVNKRLTTACADQRNRLLIPFGTVNPTLPDWEEDLRRCHEQFHMRGIRLHPNYHGYALDDPRFARLLSLAADRNLIVQIVASLDNARHRWLTPKTVTVDLSSLPKLLAKHPTLRSVIARSIRGPVNPLRTLATLKQTYFDFAPLTESDSLAKLIDRVPAGRLVFGSGAPLHSIDSMRALIHTAALQDDQRKAIAAETAGRLITARPITRPLRAPPVGPEPAARARD